MKAALILKGVLLGLGAAVPIGPVNVEIARRTLRGGFWRGFAMGCGAVTVDVTYAVLASVGLGPLLNRSWLFWPLSIGGVVLLAYLGVMCYVGAVRAIRRDPLAEPWGAGGVGPNHAGVYFTGVLMTLLNPMTVAFWFVVIPGYVRMSSENPGRDLPLVCAGVFAGALGWVVLFAGVLSVVGRFRRGWWLVAADVAGGSLLLAFAGLAFLRSIRRFL